ncbi:DUF6527 family protein [Rhodococcus sp. NBC_00297]|uniref:DUF6527 family protein n=1 Tax=Rhodococcus sp. NBC_00297 TaxID=2976005 RepID=UPI002E2ADBD4|nr:DUF6527 family protein [Rhodococcus sp. NBC_00297]
MTPTDHFAAEFVESFPSPLTPGVLYVSTKYSMTVHLCACGCGGEVAVKLAPARYRVVFDGNISLSPSVAATALPCNSHYFITRGEVDWHRQLSARQTERVRAADQRAVAAQRADFEPGWPVRLLRRLRGRA